VLEIDVEVLAVGQNIAVVVRFVLAFVVPLPNSELGGSVGLVADNRSVDFAHVAPFGFENTHALIVA